MPPPLTGLLPRQFLRWHLLKMSTPAGGALEGPKNRPLNDLESKHKALTTISDALNQAKAKGPFQNRFQFPTRSNSRPTLA